MKRNRSEFLKDDIKGNIVNGYIELRKEPNRENVKMNELGII